MNSKEKTIILTMAIIVIIACIILTFSGIANAKATSSTSSSSSRATTSNSTKSTTSIQNTSRTNSANRQNFMNNYNNIHNKSYDKTQQNYMMMNNNFLVYWIIISNQNQREQRQLYSKVAKQKKTNIYTVTIKTPDGDKIISVNKKQYNKIKEGQEISYKNNKLNMVK